MHCGACVSLIEESLLDRDGVHTATVDLESTRATVVFDPARVGVPDLQAVIARANGKKA